MKRPLAYITAAWLGGDSENAELAGSIVAPYMRQAFLLFVRLCTCPCFSTMLFPRSIKAAST